MYVVCMPLVINVCVCVCVCQTGGSLQQTAEAWSREVDATRGPEARRPADVINSVSSAHIESSFSLNYSSMVKFSSVKKLQVWDNILF